MHSTVGMTGTEDMESTLQLHRVIEKLRRELAAEKSRVEALRESEECHRSLVESSLDVIYAISREGTFISLNPAFEVATGWAVSEWIGKNFLPLVHPDDLPLVHSRFGEFIKGEANPPAEFRILTKSGKYRVFEFKTIPHMKDGGVLGILGTARDITDRHWAEKEIKYQNEFLHNVLESLTHPFYVLDSNDFTIKMANSAASPGPLPPGTTCYALTHKVPKPCDGREHLCPLQVVKETKKPLVVEQPALRS